MTHAQPQPPPHYTIHQWEPPTPTAKGYWLQVGATMTLNYACWCAQRYSRQQRTTHVCESGTDTVLYRYANGEELP